MQVIGELTTYLIELNIDRQWFDIILEFVNNVWYASYYLN